MGKLDELIRAEIGVDSTPSFNPLVSAVGVTVVQILPNNPNRLAATIVNTSANTIVIKPSPDVSLTNGIVLAPSGDAITLNYKEDFHMVGMAWYAIASGAASSIMVQSLDAIGG